MNVAQRIVVAIGLMLIVAIGLYPHKTAKRPGASEKSRLYWDRTPIWRVEGYRDAAGDKYKGYNSWAEVDKKLRDLGKSDEYIKETKLEYDEWLSKLRRYELEVDVGRNLIEWAVVGVATASVTLFIGLFSQKRSGR
ncbi:MAG TPA: hypothetical protein PLM61_06025 [Thermoanaerobaculales bacterium]|nr:hypothetical protein [Thermoanaerobaculales bacterium]